MASNPYTPDTSTVLNAFVTLATPMLLLDGVTQAYATVVLGKQENLVETTPCLEVYQGLMDDSQVKSNGGRNEDTQEFVLLSIADETNASQCELQTAQIRDALIFMLRSHVRMNPLVTGTTNVVRMRPKPQSGRTVNIMRNKREYRAYFLIVEVVSQWTNQNWTQS